MQYKCTGISYTERHDFRTEKLQFFAHPFFWIIYLSICSKCIYTVYRKTWYNYRTEKLQSWEKQRQQCNKFIHWLYSMVYSIYYMVESIWMVCSQGGVWWHTIERHDSDRLRGTISSLDDKKREWRWGVVPGCTDRPSRVRISARELSTVCLHEGQQIALWIL